MTPGSLRDEQAAWSSNGVTRPCPSCGWPFTGTATGPVVCPTCVYALSNSRGVVSA